VSGQVLVRAASPQQTEVDAGKWQSNSCAFYAEYIYRESPFEEAMAEIFLDERGFEMVNVAEPDPLNSPDVFVLEDKKITMRTFYEYDPNPPLDIPELPEA